MKRLSTTGARGLRGRTLLTALLALVSAGVLAGCQSAPAAAPSTQPPAPGQAGALRPGAAPGTPLSGSGAPVTLPQTAPRGGASR